jgi:hypothetical protein
MERQEPDNFPSYVGVLRKQVAKQVRAGSFGTVVWIKLVAILPPGSEHEAWVASLLQLVVDWLDTPHLELHRVLSNSHTSFICGRSEKGQTFQVAAHLAEVDSPQLLLDLLGQQGGIYHHAGPELPAWAFEPLPLGDRRWGTELLRSTKPSSGAA